MIPEPNRFTSCEIDAAIGLRNQAAAAVCFYAGPQDREAATIAVLLAALKLAGYEAVQVAPTDAQIHDIWCSLTNQPVDLKVARAILSTAAPQQAAPDPDRLELLEREHAEFFEKWHDERRKREALECQRAEIFDKLVALREMLA